MADYIDKYYDSGGKDHGICSTYIIQSRNLEHKISSEHPGLEICFTKTGLQSMEVRNKTQVLHPENLALYNANETHTEVYQKGHNSHFYALLLSHDYINSFLAETNIRADDLIFDKVLQKPSESLLHSLHRLTDLREEDQLDPLSLESGVNSLLIDILSDFSHSFSGTLSRQTATAHFPKKIHQVKKLIWDSFSDPNMNLDFISQRCGLSKFHLSRIFKQTCGFSIGAYVSNIRITEAKRRLKDLDQKITDIAFESGYKDLSTFNKAFTKNVKLSPRQFRKSVSS